MTVPTRLGAAFLGCAGTVLKSDEKRFFSEVQPVGFILFARNLEAPDQIRVLCQQLRDSVGWHAPILIDQEGGRVQRLRPPLADDYMPPLDQVARAGGQAARSMYLRARLIAANLLDYGIDVNCIPTLDIARADTHPVLRNRCYGEDPDTVIAMGRATVEGLRDGGILPVMKHMPGHGMAQLDSHLDLPRISAGREELIENDFRVFQGFPDLKLGMSAHLVFETIDPRPATISPVMIDLIRTEIGFDGLLMTDDISMEALDGDVATRGAAALAAGCDAVLHCNGDMTEMVLLMDRIGSLTAKAQTRANAAFSQRPVPQPIDIRAAEEELGALLG